MSGTAMRKLTRTQLRSFTISQLQAQGGICPLCQQKIDYSIPREAVCDHDHNTGEVRGILHRSCNAALGKVDNAAGCWGAKSMSYDAIVPWLKAMIAYYEKPGLGVIYPEHKTAEQKAEATRIKRNKTAAVRRASAKVRVMLPKESK